MEFSTKAESPEKARGQCVVVGVFEGRSLTDAAKALDRASKGHLSAILKGGDLEGRLGTTLLLHAVPGVAAERDLPLRRLSYRRDTLEDIFLKAMEV